ncbi:phosphatase [Nonomuraea jiangxiensis]|uniref:Phosphatase n=1 Tax=Nonomuraea jiangxiensis TaxID=633440 RepID=A0A1G9L5K5_9ACTN|nr:phosphatase [Nonomuraea jiangxiensis]SDL57194.1 Phosphatase [Nonomuraea jiangxiensis]
MLSRDDLREHLVYTRIAGDVATPRENNLDHYSSLANGDPYYMLGLTYDQPWPYRDVLALMAKSAGVISDPGHRWGQDTIDPDLTIDAIDAMAERIASVLSRDNPRVLFATGHPTGLLAIHMPLARLCAERGALLVTPGEGWTYAGSSFGRPRGIRYMESVAMLDDRGGFVHTHDAAPMRHMLGELDGEKPDLVIADHGWAGAAAEAGVPTVAFADSNDPGLFVGEAEGKIDVVVPLDDNVLPRYYAPLTERLVTQVTRAL